MMYQELLEQNIKRAGAKQRLESRQMHKERRQQQLTRQTRVGR